LKPIENTPLALAKPLTIAMAADTLKEKFTKQKNGAI